MTTINKYKIYCTTSNQFEYIWDTVAPTTCPVNAGHTVNLSSVHYIKLINVYKKINTNGSADGNNFYRLDSSLNNISFVLPSTTDNQGRIIIIQRLITNINTVTVIVDNVGTETINSSGTNTTLTLNKQTIKLKAVSTNWQLLNVYGDEGEDEEFTEGNLLRDTDNTDPGNSNYFLAWDNTLKKSVYKQIDYGNLSGSPSTIALENLTNVSSAVDPGNSKYYLGWNDTTNQWVDRQITVADLNATLDHIVLGGGTSGMTEIKYNLFGIIAPTATDDNTSGYSVGSRWIDIVANLEYVCLDSTTAAAIWINTTSQGVLTLEGLTNVNTAVDPSDEAKFLRWNDTSNEWTDDYIRLKIDTFTNLNPLQQTGILFSSSDNDSLIFYNGTEWKHAQLKDIVEDNFISQVELFSPSVWFRASDIGGGVGTLIWNSYIGSGSVHAQGSLSNYSAGVGGKNAVNIIHSPVTSTSYIFALNLGATFNASTTGFTLVIVTQDWDCSASTDGRFVSIIANDALPDGTTFVNLRAIQCNSATSNLVSYRNNATETWSSTVSDSTVDSNPTVVVMRYNPTGTEWKIWINKTTNTVVNTDILSLNSMTTIQYLYFGYDKSNIGVTAGKANLRLSDVQFYNSVLNDTQVGELSTVILREYGVRTPVYSNTTIYKDEIDALSNVNITNVSTGDLLRYNGTEWINTLKSNYSATGNPSINNDSTENYVVGSRWFDITNDKEYVCLDNSVGAAVWKETSGGGSSNGVFSSVYEFRDDTITPTNGQIVFLDAGNINQNSITTATKVRINKKDINLIDLIQLSVLTTEKLTIRRQGTGIANSDSIHNFTLTNSNTDQTTYYELNTITNKSTSGTALVNGELVVFDHNSKTFVGDISDVAITSVSTGQFLKYDGTKWINTLKSEYAKTSAPTGTDDITAGYAIGSRWLDITNNKEYICVDTTATSAVWIETTVASNITTDTDSNITGNSNLQVTGQMALATDTRRLYMYSGTNWTYTVMNNWLLHSNIDTLLSPTVRLQPSGIGGSTGAITWTASSGSPVLTQNGALVPETTSLNTGPALHVPEDNPYLHIDLGATHLGSSGFTFFAIVQDLTLDAGPGDNGSRFITLLDVTPTSGQDSDNTANVALFIQTTTTDNFTTIYNTISYNWTTGTISGTTGTPTLVVARYTSGTTELKTWINSTNALTQTVNMDSLSIRNIALGYSQISGIQDGGLRIAELIFWGSALDDNRISLITSILTDNYGITSTGNSVPNPISVSDGGTGNYTLTNNGILLGQGTNAIATLKSEFTKTKAPTCLNDVDEGYTVGSIWIDITNDKEYICLDSTADNAVWKLKTDLSLYLDTTNNVTAYINKENKTAAITTDGNGNLLIRDYTGTSGYKIIPVKDVVQNGSNNYTTFHKNIDASTLHLRATSDGIQCGTGTLVWNDVNGSSILTSQSSLVYDNINGYPALRSPTDSAYATINTGSIVDFSTNGGMTIFFTVSNIDCATVSALANRVIGWTNQAYPTLANRDSYGSSGTQPTDGGIMFSYQESTNQLSWYLEQPTIGTAASFVTTNNTGTTPLVVCLQYDASLQQFECWYNKVSQGTKARANYLVVELQYLHLFRESDGGLAESSCGTISEIIIYNSKLSNSNVTIINNLLYEKYVNSNIITSLLNEYNLGDLDNVDVNDDPNSNYKYLRWNDTNSKWTDDFIRISDGANNLDNTGRIAIDTTNDILLINTGNNIRSIFLDRTEIGYAYINTVYSPIVRWIPSGITGTEGQLVWNASVGIGTLGGQGYKANYIDNSIGGKRSIYVDATSTTDNTKYVFLDLGATYAGSGDFTIAVVVQDFDVLGSYTRFITLLDSTPLTGVAHDNLTNALGIVRDGVTNDLGSWFNNSIVTWTPGALYTDIDATPTVIFMRYTHAGTEWKIWFNKTTDTVVTTNTINFGTLTLRNIGFGFINNVSEFGKLKVSEVIFWDSPLTNQQITNISNDLLIEYGVRTTSSNIGYHKTTAPTINDDTNYNYNIGSRWLDTTNDHEYVCMDNTGGAAVWRKVTVDNLEHLLNVNTQADPGDEHKFIRWDDTNNEWVDDYLRIKTDTETNIINATTYEALNQIIFATDTRRLYMYRDPNWAYIPLNNRVFYSNINSMLIPTLRLEPTGIGGTTGSVSWSPSIGSVTVNQSGANIPETNTLNSGPAIRVLEDTPYIHLDLGTNYPGTGGFTISFVIQDLINDPAGVSNHSRFLTLLDDTPLTGADWNNTTNLQLFARVSGSDNFATFYNSISYLWSTGTISGTAGTPTVITARYNHTGTKFDVWFNDTITNNTTINMGSLIIRNIALGYANFIPTDDDGGLRIAEIIFWNSAISDTNVSLVRKVLMDKYNITTNKDVQEVGFNIENLANVASAADPADNHKFLRWNNTDNKWTDDYIRAKEVLICEESVPGAGTIYMDTGTKDLLYHDGSNWRNAVTVQAVNRYTSLNTYYSPTVRWIPDDILGVAGSLTWTSSVGSGSIHSQGTSAHYVASSVGGKKAIYVDASSNSDTTKYFILDLGTVYNGSGDMTFAFVVQDFGVPVAYENTRFISLLDSTPLTGTDWNNTTNLLALNLDGAGNPALSTYYNSINYVWVPGANYTIVDSNPTVVILRYTSATTEWKIWFNKTTDSIVNTTTVNMDALTIQYIAFGFVTGLTTEASLLRVAEVLFWDSPVTDANIEKLSCDLLTEYTVRTTGLEGGPLNIGDIGDIVLNNPQTNDIIKYDGTKWVNSSSGAFATWIYSDTKSLGTVGGTATINNWTTRVINTTNKTGGSEVSLSSNQLTIGGGDWIIDITSVFNDTDETKIRLRNISDSITVLSSLNITITGNNFITLSVPLVVSTPKIYEVQYYANATNNNTDLGFPSGIDSEVYTYIKLTKLSSTLAGWLITDSKTTGSVGGTATTGSWTTRDLNNTKLSGGSAVSLAANQITITAGSYFIDIQSPFNNTDQTRLRLMNITDATSELTSYSRTITDNSYITINATVTFSSTKILEVQYYASTTNNSTDLGIPDGIESDETYTMVRIIKI